MARMNLFIHGIHVNPNDIAWGDTLANPQHLDSDGNLKQFDVIVANMPFSLDKWAEGFNLAAKRMVPATRKRSSR